MSFSGPQISAFSASRSFHVRSLFLFGFFWFKEQEKQTESNPLSSQPRFDPYQLGVITMPLSSGVKGLRLDIKYDLTASRQGSTHFFICARDCIFKNFTYRAVSAQLEAVGARIPVTDVLQQVLSSVSLCNLYLTVVRIIIQHLFARLQDTGQLKREMLLKDSGAIKQTKKHQKTASVIRLWNDTLTQSVVTCFSELEWKSSRDR